MDKDTLRHTARLARLNLDLLPEEEVEELASQMQRIVAHVDRLREVDTAGVAATSQPHALVLSLRPDEPSRPPGPDAILAGAPARDEEHFLVPRVVGEDESS
ncbi:MAG: Asp-tRNA(Asn)/Glu-tRNA(Gln) amidotransferase subunit GatC [Deltaproteobacteria bacterium]|nr:MAG: Asp-tRNA(Asn)/Glu-tRNA(Gln) amidotransferase subunit GatC [Deltaproteobacteria bacterium]